jgi:hypothetical protein
MSVNPRGRFGSEEVFVRNPAGNGEGRGQEPQRAGSLGRGQPTSQLFDTLKHREQDPERVVFLKCLRGGCRARLTRQRVKALVWGRGVAFVGRETGGRGREAPKAGKVNALRR